MTQYTLAQLIAAYCAGIFTGVVFTIWLSQALTRRAVRADVSRHMAGIRTNLKQGG